MKKWRREESRIKDTKHERAADPSSGLARDGGCALCPMVYDECLRLIGKEAESYYFLKNNKTNIKIFAKTIDKYKNMCYNINVERRR